MRATTMEDDSPCSDEVLNALLVRLVDTTLGELRRLHYPPHGTQQLAKQLEAAAWLYYCNFHRSYPGLDYYDSSEFCKKAVILRCGLDNYLDKENGMIESRVNAACKAADYSSVDNVITRAAVLLLSLDRERCLLVKSLITEGHWSFIEVSVNQGDPVLETAVAEVQNITGLCSDSLEVEEKFYHARCMSQQGNFTRLHVIVQKSRTDVKGSLETSWISLSELISKASSALLTKTWEWEPTPALDHFHIHPFLAALREVLPRSLGDSNLSETETNICKPLTVKKELEPERTETVHSQNERVECSSSDMLPSSNTATKRKLHEEALKEDKQLSTADTTIILDSEDEALEEDLEKYKKKLRNQPAQDTQSQLSNSTTVTKQEINRNKKSLRSCSPMKTEGVTTDHSKIDKLKVEGGTTAKRQINVSVSPVSLTKDRGVMSAISPPPTVPRIDYSNLASAVKEQQQRLQKLMDIQSQVSIYNAQSAALQKELLDGETELHNSLQNYMAISLKHMPGEASFLSKLRDPVQDLEEFCVKNGWPKPRYDVETAPFKTTQYMYTVIAHISGRGIQHSEKGSHSIELQAAKQSAASILLARLYLLKSKLNTC